MPHVPPPDAEDPPPIRLRGVTQNNLKGIDVDFPYDSLTVVTGVSGSGKSSLVFDTLYAEGQRRYVETFSAYARQFLDRMPRPRAASIEHLPPAVAVEQRNPVRTSRSTVGTMTELTDHLKLLFAKAAQLHCGGCDEPVREETASHVADAVEALPDGIRITLTFPLPPSGGLPFEEQVRGLRAAGLARALDPGSGRAVDVGSLQPPGPDAPPLAIVLDRLVAGGVERSRVLDSAEQGFRLGRGRMTLRAADRAPQPFSEGRHCPACDLSYRDAVPNLFSFNSPLGACPTCRGFGRTIDLDVGLAVPDHGRTLADGAIRPWTTPRTRDERRALRDFAAERGIPMDRPWRDLEEAQRSAIIDGEGGFFGVRGWMRWLERKAYKLRVRVLLARYRAYVTCAECRGTRRRPESLLWRLGGRHIHAWETLPIEDALQALWDLKLPPSAAEVASVVREAIEARLRYLTDVGLGYLTLDRATRTLSGGEFQRVNLATALGAALVNTLYVLDEPSVGLHPRDTHRLLGILHQLRDRGNTLVVVEHDPDTIAAADYVVDLGPQAGERGGEILYQGPLARLRDSPDSLTARYLRGEERVGAEAGSARPLGPADEHLVLRGCRGHNLRGIDVAIPVGRLVAVVGVSGSGKSSLVTGTLHPALQRHLGESSDEPLPHTALEGAERFARCDLVDQRPIGRTSRSNPATYIGAMLHIRKLLAATDTARRLKLSAKSFSFNSRGGRCPACEGAGQEVLEMQFLADVAVPCEECAGKRFKPAVLLVKLRGLDVNGILDLPVDAALRFFDGDGATERKIRTELSRIADLGLGYLRLGQSATTLSGGEAQRLKLASHLRHARGRRNRGGKRTLFLLDEPTTGLHLADVRTLLGGLRRLVDDGHTVVVIEHHMGVAAAADHVIELGPGGGAAGGRIVAAGSPAEVARKRASPTAPFLRAELATASGDRRGAGGTA